MEELAKQKRGQMSIQAVGVACANVLGLVGRGGALRLRARWVSRDQLGDDWRLGQKASKAAGRKRLGATGATPHFQSSRLL